MTQGACVLAIASAAGGGAVAVVRDGQVLAEAQHKENQGLAAALPLLVADVMDAAGPPDIIACVVGPGSFTGLRAGLSLAQGLAAGGGAALVGVTVAEAIAEALPALGTRALWVAMAGRSGHVFLDRDGDLAAFPLNALPAATGKIAVAGDAANTVAATLAARGTDVMLTSARLPTPSHVARVALRRAAGTLPPIPCVPLYVDAPLAKLPATGLRPAPV